MGCEVDWIYLTQHGFGGGIVNTVLFNSKAGIQRIIGIIR